MKKYFRPAYIAALVMVACISGLIYTSPTVPTLDWLKGQLPAEPPVPVRESLDYVVEVANQNEHGLFKGYGVTVDYKGVEFILTSRMLFTPTGEVTVNGMAASVIAVNLTSDLVALQIDNSAPNPPYLELLPVWRPESAALTTHTQTLVRIANSNLRVGWAELDYAPIGSEGAPLFQDGDLTGLFLGFSERGTPIVATNDALVKFARRILEIRL